MASEGGKFAEASGLRACRGRLVATNPPILQTYKLQGRVYPPPTPAAKSTPLVVQDLIDLSPRVSPAWKF